MKMKSLKESFANFRRTMKGMSWEECIDHIWAYYKWEMLLILVIALVVYGLISWIFSTPVQTVFSGNITNCQITDRGYQYLTEDYLQTLNVETDESRITLGFTNTAGLNMDTANPAGMDGGVRVAVMVADGSLDYIISDTVGLEFYAIQGSYENIQNVLTQEQLSQFSDKLYYHTDEESGESIPIAIDISDLAFADDCMEDGKKIYLGFPIHAPHPALLTEFFEYILAWQQ